MGKTWWRRESGRQRRARVRRRSHGSRSCPRTFRPRAEYLENRILLSTNLLPILTPLGADYPTGLTNVGGIVYFAATDAVHGTELWRSDGTTAGTWLVKDVNPARASAYPGAPAGPASSDPANLTAVNGTLFFTADDGSHRPELWKSDGTAAGTVLVKAFDTPLPPGSLAADLSFGIHDLTAYGGELYFTAYDPLHGRQLWASDGTTVGTHLVTVLDAGGAIASDPAQLTAVARTLFFTAVDKVHGRELWESDGTAAGTALVEDINPGAGGSNPSELTAVGATLLFAADDGIHGRELWRSDGTAAGTTLVTDINPGPGSSSPSDLTALGGTVFFAADDGAHGRELWKSDGTAAGTVLVKDIAPDFPGQATAANSSIPADLTVGGSVLFFTAGDGVHGRELWESDGTPAGTVLVRDINQTLPPGSGGTASANPLDLTNLRGELYFTADDGVHGRELWRSDGTAAGTVRLADLVPGPTPAFASGTVTGEPGWLVVGDGLFFAAGNGTGSVELWKLQGGAAVARTAAARPPVGLFPDLAALLFAADPPDLTSLGGAGRPLPPGVSPGGPGTAAVPPALTASPPSSTGHGDLVPDQDGDAGVENHRVFSVVPAAALADEASGTAAIDVRAIEGRRYDGVVANVSAPAPGQATGRYSAWINWGDGTPATTGNVRRVGDQLGIHGRHTYPGRGSYAVQVTIEADGVPLGTVTGTARVEPALAEPPAVLPSPSDEAPTPEDGFGPMSLGPAQRRDAALPGALLCGLVLPLWDIFQRKRHAPPGRRTVHR